VISRKAHRGPRPKDTLRLRIAPGAQVGRNRPIAHDSSSFLSLSDNASRRYRPAGMGEWQFARGKLRGDPVYRAVWEGPWIREGTVVDVGCGCGLMLALFAAARENASLYPSFRGRAASRLIGVETRQAVATRARQALGTHAEIISADARGIPLPCCQTLLLFDVLSMIPAADQETLLETMVDSLEPGGVLLIRDVDASAGWRFHMVKIANRIKALLLGYSSRGFHFRTLSGWCDLLRHHGLQVSTHAMSHGTPFANVLLVAQRLNSSEKR